MEKISRRTKSLPSPRAVKETPQAIRRARFTLAAAMLLLLLNLAPPLHAREQKKKKADYGAGLSTEISSPEDTVCKPWRPW
jgi:hypothetical protein